MAYPFELPELGYDYGALEPHIDARTMEIHHTKHHKAYTDKLNEAVEKHAELHAYTAEQLLRAVQSVPADVRTAVRNHGGGFHNHRLFWDVMRPGGADAPGGELSGALDEHFGSFGDFQKKLSDAAAGQFGSGWGWLCVSPFGDLAVLATANQDSPLMDGYTPILGVDVWEHAYYLNYQNRRPDYLKAWWNVVNWDVVGKRFEAARGGWVDQV
jgi:Fe-Mn family superoxide dismutase